VILGMGHREDATSTSNGFGRNATKSGQFAPRALSG
jgi:hypothetical protein